MCENTKISEKFFERYIKFVKWEYISKNVNLSKEFFERHNEYIDWEIFFQYSKIINKFSKYFEKGDWYYICKNKNIDEKFINKHLKKGVKMYWDFLSENTYISPEFLLEKSNEILENIDWYRISNNTFKVNHSRDKIISWLKKIQFTTLLII